MALTGDTGNGATLTLALFNGTTAITAALDVISITPGKMAVAPIDVSTLATTGYTEMIPGDLATVGEGTATFKANGASTAPTLPSAAGTITITLPLQTGATTPGGISGTGFLTGYQPPALQNGVLQVGTVNWQWDGDTGPAQTASS